MVTRDDELSSAFLFLLKVHMVIVCFWDSEIDYRHNDRSQSQASRKEQMEKTCRLEYKVEKKREGGMDRYDLTIGGRDK